MRATMVRSPVGRRLLNVSVCDDGKAVYGGGSRRP